ncbi:DUF4783 domain-containing protein [Cytophagaceae bacterium ABcell3]|nr:DUF4783 domain-containing protein [Cytophagaceae bacterium ABcell3]
MKLHNTFYYFGIFSLLLLCSFSHNSQQEPLDNIMGLIRTANLKELTGYLDKEVKVILPGEEKNYKNTQAASVLDGFFKKHPPSNLSLLHKGKSNKDAQYGIANYSSEDKNFRVYIYLKTIDASLVIQEIKIEEQ